MNRVRFSLRGSKPLEFDLEKQKIKFEKVEGGITIVETRPDRTLETTLYYANILRIEQETSKKEKDKPEEEEKEQVQEKKEQGWLSLLFK